MQELTSNSSFPWNNFYTFIIAEPKLHNSRSSVYHRCDLTTKIFDVIIFHELTQFYSQDWGRVVRSWRWYSADISLEFLEPLEWETNAIKCWTKLYIKKKVFELIKDSLFSMSDMKG